MPRARSIKHSFFTNDDLADLTPIVRLLFIGLWTLADRAGRLEDRPRRIKALLFPYDDVNVDQSLQELADTGMVTRYRTDGGRYLAVNNFGKHQNPHINEKQSTIPAPDKHGASTVQKSLTPDSLTPDSLSRDAPAGAAAPKQPVSRTNKATLLPEDFELPDDWRAYCREKRADLDPDQVFEDFCDHFHSAPAERARKRDWKRTWQRWVRNERRTENGTGPRETPVQRSERKEREAIATIGGRVG